MRKHRKHSFTLIELLMVMAIIAILMGIGLGIVGVVNRKQAETATRATIKTLETALSSYKQKYGYYPLQRNTSAGSSTYKNYFIIGVGTEYDTSFTQFIGNWEEFKQNYVQTGAISGTDYIYVVDAYGYNLLCFYPGIVNKTSFDIVSKGGDGRCAYKYTGTSKVYKDTTDDDGDGIPDNEDNITNFN